MGDLFRKGLPTSMAPNLENLLERSNKARTEEARGQPPPVELILPNTPEELLKGTPQFFREAINYYRGQI